MCSQPITSHQLCSFFFFFFSSSCCLAGRAYPLGDIPEDLVPLVKNQVGAVSTVFARSTLLVKCRKDEV